MLGKVVVNSRCSAMDDVRQLRKDAEAATAAHAVARGAERYRLLGVVMDLRKREVAACDAQRARLESGAALESVEETGACALQQGIAAVGACSAWLMLAQDGEDPADVAECRDRARGWLAEAEHRCVEALFLDLALADSPALLAARDAVLSVKRELE